MDTLIILSYKCFAFYFDDSTSAQGQKGDLFSTEKVAQDYFLPNCFYHILYNLVFPRPDTIRFPRENQFGKNLFKNVFFLSMQPNYSFVIIILFISQGDI
jgi:hypothetical protein